MIMFLIRLNNSTHMLKTHGFPSKLKKFCVCQHAASLFLPGAIHMAYPGHQGGLQDGMYTHGTDGMSFKDGKGEDLPDC